MARFFHFVIAAAAGLALMGLTGGVAALAEPIKGVVPDTAGKQIEISQEEVDSGLAERSVNLPEGKARLISLPVEVGNVLVADPAVADVVVMSARQIYLIGLTAGDTNAFFLDDNGAELLRLDVRVQLDVASANRSLQSLLPGADIKVTAIKSHLFLTGSVRTSSVSKIAQVTASRFVAKDANVINMLLVVDDQLGTSKLPPAPKIAPVAFESENQKPYIVKIYRATAPSTALIRK